MIVPSVAGRWLRSPRWPDFAEEAGVHAGAATEIRTVQHRFRPT